jgi:hypothetical protein
LETHPGTIVFDVCVTIAGSEFSFPQHTAVDEIFNGVQEYDIGDLGITHADQLVRHICGLVNAGEQ